MGRAVPVFRYEVRCWRGGVTPDVDEAVDSPRHLTSDPVAARCVLDLAPRVPTAVWGRDELGAGEMSNSNAIVARLVARSASPPRRSGLPQAGGLPAGARGSSWRGATEP